MNKMIISSDMSVTLYTPYVLRVELHERPMPEIPAAMAILGGSALTRGLAGLALSPLGMTVPRYEKPSEDVYTSLHNKLSAAGFFRLVGDVNNTCYALPPGTYFGRVTETPEELYKTLQVCVDSVWSPNTIFLAQATRWVGANLETVRQ